MLTQDIARQAEITRQSPLLDADGKLVQDGWARQPLLDCNLENARVWPRPLQALRLKRWDYYAVTTPDLFFSATLAHLGYVGTAFVYVLDFASGELREETMLTALGRGVHLARNSGAGESHLANRRVRVAFRAEESARRVQVDWPSFNRGEGIAADFTLHCGPDHESVVTVTPMKGRRFFYTRKVNCLPAEGGVSRGGRRFELRPADSLGNMDWGRGIWEYRTDWIWASASAFLEDGRTLGLNMGGGFGGAPAPDNAFIVNGRVHKLEDVQIGYDRADLMRPWQMKSPDGRLDLGFVPFKERVARTNLLLVRSELRQVFGRYSGTLSTDDGEALQVRDLTGFIEAHQARW